MGPGTRDPETRNLGPWDLAACDPGTWDPDTREPGNETLEP